MEFGRDGPFMLPKERGRSTNNQLCHRAKIVLFSRGKGDKVKIERRKNKEVSKCLEG